MAKNVVEKIRDFVLITIPQKTKCSEFMHYEMKSVKICL